MVTTILTKEALVSKTIIILYQIIVILREHDESRFKRLKIEYSNCSNKFKLGDNPSLAVPQIVEITLSFDFEEKYFSSISWELNLNNFQDEVVKKKIKYLLFNFTSSLLLPFK